MIMGNIFFFSSVGGVLKLSDVLKVRILMHVIIFHSLVKFFVIKQTTFNFYIRNGFKTFRYFISILTPFLRH